VNAARLTRGSGSSSWPTMHMGSNERGAYYDKTGKGQRYLSDAVVDEQKNWPTIRASEYKDVGPVGSKSHDHMLGKHYLCAVVTQEEASWPTPCAMEAEKAGLFNKGQMGQSLSAMANRGELCMAKPPRRAATRLGAAKSCGRRQACPTAEDYSGTGRTRTPIRGKCVRACGEAMGQSQQANDWATSRTCTPKWQPGIGEERGLGAQRKHAEDATGGPESAQRKQELGRTTSGGGDLASQAMTQWGSPRTGIRGDTHFSYDRGKHNIEEQAGASMKGGGKLNPRWVETLMGLPIGWTMPSCIRPVTTAPTSCDSSETALCRPAQSERSDFLLASCGKEPTKPK
jgi:hypothetical protein